jgi:hypothetical protein
VGLSVTIKEDVMQPNQWVILVLKPTPTFLTFLKAQLPADVELPNIQTLLADTTAYVMRNRLTDEATFDEIEHHFPWLFRHEIARWLGKHARNTIEGTFLDFLCCFKFEIHSNLVVMESSLDKGSQILRIKPRTVMLKWIKSSMEKESAVVDVLERVQLSQLTENCTVVVKNFEQLANVKTFMGQYYAPLFEAEMRRMSSRVDQWPSIQGYEDFNRYFAVQIHTQLVHLPY